jgi:putative ABC transport system permease protein
MAGFLRAKRGLKPTQENNFALNKTEFIQNAIGSIFDVISVAGWVIGGFSILVGGFGIANIMFVSVRERTNIIGIQKSLGAKNYFILFQFLFEAICLSLIGGGSGILLVYLLSFIPLGSLELVLSFNNIILGLGVSSVIGVVAGIVPATLAARMDPVEAIRTNSQTRKRPRMFMCGAFFVTCRSSLIFQRNCRFSRQQSRSSFDLSFQLIE